MEHRGALDAPAHVSKEGNEDIPGVLVGEDCDDLVAAQRFEDSPDRVAARKDFRSGELPNLVHHVVERGAVRVPGNGVDRDAVCQTPLGSALEVADMTPHRDYALAERESLFDVLPSDDFDRIHDLLVGPRLGAEEVAEHSPEVQKHSASDPLALFG